MTRTFTAEEMLTMADRIASVGMESNEFHRDTVEAMLRHAAVEGQGPKRCGTCRHWNKGEVFCNTWRGMTVVPTDGSGFCHLHSEDKP